MIATAATPGDLTGISALFVELIDRLGEVGVAVLTLVETVIPPVPSEVVLPLSGFLAQQGHLSVLWVLVASTVGSLVGAWIFYGLGAALGLERSAALVAKVPLVDREDVVGASDWFHRHGRGAVLFGRLVPGVRSLISLPAGAQRMPMATFSVATAIGSGVWNAILVGAGYALGTQWDTVGAYASTFSNVVIVVLVIALLVALRRRARRRRRTTAPPADRLGAVGDNHRSPLHPGKLHSA
ncbi:DedA family protein [Georgenia muralis]|uniref:Membrane protein DedA with SNARE-associated domain n=1 Tax=Georgenia muralis TaxID=154117 RepID=A0A3N4ZR64_9MICO|nr:DedA family protein [Georgenia muralis]RPF28028.1 membrane protein DedA with SNARE-associated domain [Georgenia muralis]